jgi:uncharacterized protein (TIGR02246 family)
MLMRPALVVAVLLLAGGCVESRPQSPPPMDAERARLDQRQDEFFAAVAARDSNRTAALFAEDAVLHVANMPAVEGREAIRQFYENMFGFLSASSAVPEATRMSASADLAYTVGRTVNEFRRPHGAVEFAGKFVLLWQRSGGEWMITLYGVSSNDRLPSAGG